MVSVDTVVCTLMIAPGSKVRSTPSGPAIASVACASSNTMTLMNAAPSAACMGEVAAVAPTATRGAIAASEMSYTRTSWPAAMR